MKHNKRLSSLIDPNCLRDSINEVVKRRVEAELSQAKDIAGLRRFMRALPDFTQNQVMVMFKVPDGTFHSPLVEAVYNTMLAAVVGSGRSVI